MMSVRLVSTLLACAGALAAVQSTAQPAAVPAAPPTPAQLAALAFGGWSEAGAGRLRTVDLPPEANAGHGAYASWSAGANRVLVEPRLVLRTDATHATLIAGLVPAGEDGKPAAAHVTPMALAAYQFEARGGRWTLARRQGVFALRGFFGAAAVRAVALSDRRQAVAVEYGSCWQGYCGTWLALYEADGKAVRHEPAVELALSGVNVDSTSDCLRRLQPLIKPRPLRAGGRDDGGAPNDHDCYSIDGSWSIGPARRARDEPGDLVLRYRGAMSRADARTAAPVAVDQRQVLRYGSGKYRAISGYDPIPPI